MKRFSELKRIQIVEIKERILVIIKRATAIGTLIRPAKHKCICFLNQTKRNEMKRNKTKGLQWQFSIQHSTNYIQTGAGEFHIVFVHRNFSH